MASPAGLQQTPSSKATAINFGKMYLFANLAVSANNSSASQKEQWSADATATMTIITDKGAAWSLIGDVYGGGNASGVGKVVTRDQAPDYRPTKFDLQNPILQFGYDLQGQSANVSIVPAPFSRTGGASSVFIPLSFLNPNSVVQCIASVSTTQNEKTDQTPSLTFWGQAVAGFGLAKVKGAVAGKLFVDWQLSGDPKNSQAIGAGGNPQFGGGPGSNNAVFQFDNATGKVTRR